MLAIQHGLVIHTGDRVEDCPHDLRVVDLAFVVANVQAENNLIQLLVLDTDALVAQRRWQVLEEVGQSVRLHLQITHRVVFGPGVLESLDVLLLEGENVVLVIGGLVVVEALANDGNEHIHEDEEGHQLVKHPEHD